MEQIARSAKQIGAIIRRKRRQAKLTQNELGVKTSLRQATISKLESGEPNSRLGTLLDDMAALGLEVVNESLRTGY
jgi:HTH-type transcriptional regulator/antitoxin HipB